MLYCTTYAIYFHKNIGKKKQCDCVNKIYEPRHETKIYGLALYVNKLLWAVQTKKRELENADINCAFANIYACMFGHIYII